jgi:hypothetical protein
MADVTTPFLASRTDLGASDELDGAPTAGDGIGIDLERGAAPQTCASDTDLHHADTDMDEDVFKMRELIHEMPQDVIRYIQEEGVSGKTAASLPAGPGGAA